MSREHPSDIDNPVAEIPDNPYVGPRTFTSREKHLFFGREREAQELVELVITEPLVLFTAQSGAGKSSLLNTRLIPRLKELDFTVLPIGRVGGNPASVGAVENVFVFNLLLSLDEKKTAPETLAQMTLSDYLMTPSDNDDGGNTNDGKSRVLIIDQFEEILTTHLTRWSERAPFFYQLNEAILNYPNLWVVLTMRDDYVAALDPFLHLLTNRMRARYYMQRMTARAAKSAIEEPAKLGKRPFADGVANKLIADLRKLNQNNSEQPQYGEFVEPVQLQVVCFQLWQNLQGTTHTEIRHEDLAALGDVDTALARFYEQTIAAVVQKTNVNELKLRTWFQRHLITEAGTRGTINQGFEKTGDLPNEVVQLLDQKFILRTERRTGSTWYELIHDRFIEPILSSNQKWEEQQSPIIQAASTWDQKGRPVELLFEGSQLETALEKQQDTENPIVADFLHASQLRAADKQRAIAEEERRKADKQAEAEKAAAQRMRKLAIALFVVVAVTIIAALIAAGASVQASNKRDQAIIAGTEAWQEKGTAEAASTLAINEQGTAEFARATAELEEGTAIAVSNIALTEEGGAQATRYIAETNEADAQAARSTAAANEGTAVAYRNEALTRQAEAETLRVQTETQRQILLAQALAFQALDAIQQTNDTELALLLALEAENILSGLTLPDDAETLQTIENDRAEVRVNIERALQGIVTQPYFNTTFRAINEEQTGHQGEVLALAFTDDAERLTAIDSQGLVISWSLLQPTDSMPFSTTLERVSFYDVTSDGSTVAIADEQEILIYQVTDANATPLRLSETFPIKSMALAPDGQTLAVAVDSFVEYLHWWDLSSSPERPIVSSSTNGLGFEQLIYNPNNVLYGRAPNNRVTDSVFIWPTTAAEAFIQITDMVPIAFSANGAMIAYGMQNDNSPSVPSAPRIPLSNSFPPGSIFSANQDVETLQPPLTFSPDGTQFFDIDPDSGDIRVWQVDIGSRSAQNDLLLKGHANSVSSLAVSGSDSQIIAAGNEDGSIRLWWRLDGIENVEQLLERGCELVKRNLTREEWDTFLRGDSYRRTCSNWP